LKQTPDFRGENNNRDKWNIKNYEFIPLIRFYEISSVDFFFDKVHPFKHVIPIHIYEKVMEFYMKNMYRRKSRKFNKRFISSTDS
jgi:hypothetical protein